MTALEKDQKALSDVTQAQLAFAKIWAWKRNLKDPEYRHLEGWWFDNLPKFVIDAVHPNRSYSYGGSAGRGGCQSQAECWARLALILAELKEILGVI